MEGERLAIGNNIAMLPESRLAEDCDDEVYKFGAEDIT